MSKRQKRASVAPPPPKPTLFERLLALPRGARILIATAVALVVILVVSPLVDNFYLNNYYDASTIIVPSLLSSALGLIMYVWGWWLYIGWRGQPATPHRIVFALYCAVTVICLVLALVLVLGGLSIVSSAASVS